MEDYSKPKTSITAIIISVVISAVVIGGGIYFYMDDKATKDQETLKNQISTLETEKADLEKQISGSTTTDETETSTAATPVAIVSTAGWKTFTNKTYNFSFKYPATDAVNSESSDSDNDIYVRTSDGYWLYRITVSSNTANQTLDYVANSEFEKLETEINDWAEEEGAATPLYQKSDLLIGGVMAKKITTQSNVGYSPSAKVVLIKDNNLITISPRIDSDEFSTILSTFQFTE